MAGTGIGEALIAAAGAVGVGEGLRAVGAPPILRIPTALAAGFVAPQAAGAAFPGMFGAGTGAGAGAGAGIHSGSELALAGIPEAGIAGAPKAAGLGSFFGEKLSPAQKLMAGLTIGTLGRGLLTSPEPLPFQPPGAPGIPGRGGGGFRPTSDAQLQALMQLMALNRQQRFFGR